MANTSLFASMRGKLLPATNTVNAEAAPAYALESREALAQLAATGCLNRTYYATAENQLEEVLRLAQEVDAEFIGKTAIYARRHGFMKDMPALLLACLTVPDSDGKVRSDLVTQVFGQVIDNGRMLRTFVQIMRSGS